MIMIAIVNRKGIKALCYLISWLLERFYASKNFQWPIFRYVFWHEMHELGLHDHDTLISYPSEEQPPNPVKLVKQVS